MQDTVHRIWNPQWRRLTVWNQSKSKHTRSNYINLCLNRNHCFASSTDITPQRHANAAQMTKLSQIKFDKRTLRFARFPSGRAKDLWWTEAHADTINEQGGPAIRNPRSTILGREKGGRDIIETLIPFATICVRHAYIMIVHANPARNPTIQDSRASTTKSEPGLKFRSHPLQSLHLTSSWITTYYKFPNTNLTNPPQSSTTHRHGSTTPHLGDDKSRICWPRRPLNPGGCHISGCESSSSSMLSSVFANQTLR